MHWWKYFSQRTYLRQRQSKCFVFSWQQCHVDCQIFFCHFSTIRSGTTRGSISTGTQIFTFFFCQLIYEFFAKHLISLCQIHHFKQKFAFFEKLAIVKVAFTVLSFEFCSNLSCILPKFAISPRFAILIKISNCQQTIFRYVIWQAIHYFLPTSLFSPNLSLL